jgi:hypothetical protein
VITLPFCDQCPCRIGSRHLNGRFHGEVRVQKLHCLQDLSHKLTSDFWRLHMTWMWSGPHDMATVWMQLLNFVRFACLKARLKAMPSPVRFWNSTQYLQMFGGSGPNAAAIPQGVESIPRHPGRGYIQGNRAYLDIFSPQVVPPMALELSNSSKLNRHPVVPRLLAKFVLAHCVMGQKDWPANDCAMVYHGLLWLILFINHWIIMVDQKKMAVMRHYFSDLTHTTIVISSIFAWAQP